MNASYLLSATLITGAITASANAQEIWDLKADWSDSQNPNGVWSYNRDATALPHVNDWPLGGFSCPQPGWAVAGNAVPFWWRSSCPSKPGQDWEVGDILVHTADPGQANVTWTSPINGVIDISGSVWMTHYPFVPARPNHWRLSVRDRVVSEGDLSPTDGYTRTNPFRFSDGAGTPAALTGIRVRPGDVVKLELARTAASGTVVGVDFNVRRVWTVFMTTTVLDIQVCWTSQPGKQYQVESRNAGTGDAWTPVGPPVEGNGSENCIIDPILGHPNRIYRVRELP